MKHKTLYKKPDDQGWCEAISIDLDTDNSDHGVERAHIRWTLQLECPGGQLWVSNRGERAFCLPVILDPVKLAKIEEAELEYTKEE